ncbi:hypothetical protein VTJ04DRAFT_6759 [Mycothermus thermophilus]|uniref:uncharacterized protein n=1 Tax=Humicola insolens TaxID=85995 RepID=UPI0037423BD8
MARELVPREVDPPAAEVPSRSVGSGYTGGDAGMLMSRKRGIRYPDSTWGMSRIPDERPVDEHFTIEELTLETRVATKTCTLNQKANKKRILRNTKGIKCRQSKKEPILAFGFPVIHCP